jgi:hypothetical protein
MPTDLPLQDRKALTEAAAAFEALMLRQMLQAARPDRQGPEADALSLADEALARRLVAGSPFGVARLLESDRK